jgi:DNA-binding GntR family transcriptional regulator
MCPAPLNGDQAAELNVVVGAPGLFLTRTSYDQNNQVVEFDQEFWRHDIIEIALEVVNNAVDSE